MWQALLCNVCNEIFRRDRITGVRYLAPSLLYGRVRIAHRGNHGKPDLFSHLFHGIPAELLEALRKSGCCLSVLEDMLMDDDVIYDK